MHIEVVAAVIERSNCFLVTKRQEGVHLAGFWEFPGGKVGRDESHAAALRREIVEELDADVMIHELMFQTSHRYPERAVSLFFYRCDLLGSPRPMIGQEMEWVPREKLASLRFPPADDELIQRLSNDL